MDMEGLSAICAGLGVVEEDRNGNRIGYSKGEYCLGKSFPYFRVFSLLNFARKWLIEEDKAAIFTIFNC